MCAVGRIEHPSSHSMRNEKEMKKNSSPSRNHPGRSSSTACSTSIKVWFEANPIPTELPIAAIVLLNLSMIAGLLRRTNKKHDYLRARSRAGGKKRRKATAQVSKRCPWSRANWPSANAACDARFLHNAPCWGARQTGQVESPARNLLWLSGGLADIPVAKGR